MSVTLPSLGISNPVTLTVEIAFTTAPLATPTWVDVTQYVRSISTQRGRSSERDQVQPGTATFVLDNTDRRFTPENSGSPHSPFVKPSKRIRAYYQYGAGPTTGYIYDGYVDGWPMKWPDKGNIDSVVEVPATDAFKMLAHSEISATEVQELSGTRINNILDDAGWPSGATWRDIDPGTLQVIARTYTCVGPLEEIRKTQDSEPGLFFIDNRGRAAFHDDDYRGAQTIAETFSDDGVDLPYQAGDGLVFSYDDDQIWNRVEGTRVGGAAAIAAEDSTSITDHGKRLLTLNDLLVKDDTDLTTLVQRYRNRYYEATLRAKTLIFAAEQLTADADYAVLGLDLERLIRVKRDAPGTGTPQVITQDCFIESVNHEITADPLRWDVTWELSQDPTPPA